MEKIVLKATKREVIGKQVKQLRRAGQLPAVIYGHHLDPISISLDAHEAGLKLIKAGSSSLITISVDGKDHVALVQDRQRNYIKNVLTHVDFLAVSMDEKLRAYVAVQVTGLSLAVKDHSAILVTGLDRIHVECFPQDLPERIVVDISTLNNVGDGIHVRDITHLDKVRILDNEDEMVIVATAAAKEEVAAVAAVVATTEGPEVIEKGKKDEEAEE